MCVCRRAARTEREAGSVRSEGHTDGRVHNHVYYLAMGASENTFKAASLFLLFFGMQFMCVPDFLVRLSALPLFTCMSAHGLSVLPHSHHSDTPPFVSH